MKPILKWAGGKTTELDIIKNHIPKNFDRLIEPFLGGGAFYFDVEHEKSIVNDFNKELIYFYRLLKDEHSFSKFKDIINIVDNERNSVNNIFYDENFEKNCFNLSQNKIYEKFLLREFKSKKRTIDRINKIKEIECSPLLNDKEIYINKKTAAISSFYYMYREFYNQKNRNAVFDIEHITFWFIMREICYSGMFRYSSSGDFNVPYGGISYNNKSFLSKLKNIENIRNKDFYINTEFNNLDFEVFFEKYEYFNKEDFIFLDPPYDSEFSQYNKESDFSLEDQIRLKNILMKTNAKIMVIIKETDFIYQLYKNDFNISYFDKSYSVNIKNRNNRTVNHLIIKNY